MARRGPRNLRHLDTVVRRSKAARDPARRYCDLALQFRIVDGPDEGCLTRPFGGVWDRDAGAYSTIWDPAADAYVGGAPPEHVHVVEVAAQSVAFIEDFDSKIVFALGGRRSGKTTGSLAPKLLVMMLCLPGKMGGVLSPTYRQSGNVWRAVLRHTPHWWWADLQKTERRMTLINGSSVVLISADKPGSSRSEGVAWGCWDERQDIKEAAAGNALMSVSEGAGSMQIIETGTVKKELREHYNKLIASPNARVYPMRSRGNPFISHEVFDLAEEFLDRATILRELEAVWPDIEGRCYYPFQEAQHARPWPLPDLSDATEGYTLGRFDHRAAWLIGVDPPGSALIAKLYNGEVLHVAHEIVIQPGEGDVRDLARMCRARIGDDGALVVSDPHETKWDADVKKYFKQFSMRFLSMRRVEREYRLTAVRARLERTKLLVSPECRHLIESLLEQQYVNGAPDKATFSRLSPKLTLDHIVDALGYLIYRLWPPLKNADYIIREKELRRAA